MAIFYTDSGSFNNLEVTGSTILSGSLIVSGSTNFGPSGLTGSLFGTASYADSASYALTASYATNAVSTPAFPFSGSAVITGSLTVSGSSRVTGSLELSRLYTSTFTATRSVVLNNNSDYQFIITGSGWGGGYGSAGIQAGITDGGFGTNARLELNNNGFGQPSSLIIRNFGDWDQTPDAYIEYTGGNGLTINSAGTGYLYLQANGKGITVESNFTPGHVAVGGNVNATNRLSISGSVSASSYTSSLNNQVGFLGTSSFAVSSSRAVTAENGFPFSGSAVITGSLLVSGSGLTVTGSLNATGSITSDNLTVTNTASIQSLTVGISPNTRGRLTFGLQGTPYVQGVWVDANDDILDLNASTVNIGLGNTIAINNSGDPELKTIQINAPITTGVTASAGIRTTIVSASSYTSSLNNQVGFLGTSSFAVSSSYATSASYVASASFDGYINFANGLVVTGSTILSGSGNSLQVTGSTVLRDNLTVNGGTLFVDATNNRVNMNGSSVITGSLVVSGSTIVTGSLSLNGNATASVNHLIIDDTTGASGNRGVIDFTRAFVSGKKTTITANIFGPALTLDSGVVKITDKFTIDNIDAFEARLNLPLTTQLTASAGIITTNISASAGITGSLAQFNPVSLKLTVGTTAPSSPAVNDLWVDTN